MSIQLLEEVEKMLSNHWNEEANEWLDKIKEDSNWEKLSKEHQSNVINNFKEMIKMHSIAFRDYIFHTHKMLQMISSGLTETIKNYTGGTCPCGNCKKEADEIIH